MTTTPETAPGSAPELLTLSDGSQIVIRPVEPADKALLSAGFAALSPESRRNRFLHAVDELDASTLRYLTEIDHVDHEALGAVGLDGEPVGVARYVRREDDPQVAEVAVVVVDRWQRRGVATALFTRLARRARACGIRRFSATVRTDNEDVLAMLSEFASAPAGASGLVEIDVPLDDVARWERALREVLRHAGAQRLGVLGPERPQAPASDR